MEYAHLSMQDAALHHARISGEVNPDNAGGAYNIAHLYLFSGNIDAARPIVQQAMTRWPSDYLAQLAQAELQYFSNDCSGAVRSTEVARPAFQSPASSVDAMTDAWNLPILVWCLRQQGSLARAQELARAYQLQFAPPIVAGAYDGIGARVAAAVGNRTALLGHLENMARTHAMDLTFVRAEPMLQPFLGDHEVMRLLDRLDGYRADWRKIIPKSSMRVAVPARATSSAGS
jgi:tetratricopeptide (TPR) repeat protein